MTVKKPHILRAASNVRRMLENLAAALPPTVITALEAEIHLNASGLYGLGRNHYLFASSAAANDWRQRVSRLYYAALNVSRAVRFEFDGYYSQDVSDHKKIGELPSGFPSRALYQNQLPILREDRNVCDYDHTAEESDLALGVAASDQLAAQLLQDAKAWFASRGINA